MSYYIEFTETAEKELLKLKDKELQNNILTKINELKTYPQKGKHLFKNYYELKAKNYRIYYAVYKGMVIIENITYSGRIKIEKIGTKNSQRRDINGFRH